MRRRPTNQTAMSPSVTAFIKRHLQLLPVPGLPSIRLYASHAGSRLSQLADPDDPDPPPPYWAFAWAGGLALAHYLAEQPHLAAGRRILDLGAGSGLVGIAAAQAGATVWAAEIDPHGRAAITLNAAANGVAISLREIDLDGPAPAHCDVIVAGDVFYNAEVAASMLPFLQRCQDAGIDVLIGDPDRRDLPITRLERVASYPVGDVGDARDKAERRGAVYRLHRL